VSYRGDAMEGSRPGVKPRAITKLRWAAALTLACIFVLHAACASLASRWYYTARYASESRTLGERLDLCRRAHALYLWNHLLAAWAARQAYYAGDAVPAVEAARWSEIAFHLNPLSGDAAHVRAEVLARTSPAAAIALWEGAPVRAALVVDEPSRTPCPTTLYRDLFAVFGESTPLYQLEWVPRAARRRRDGLTGLGDFGDLERVLARTVAR